MERDLFILKLGELVAYNKWSFKSYYGINNYIFNIA